MPFDVKSYNTLADYALTQAEQWDLGLLLATVVPFQINQFISAMNFVKADEIDTTVAILVSCTSASHPPDLDRPLKYQSTQYTLVNKLLGLAILSSLGNETERPFAKEVMRRMVTNLIVPQYFHYLQYHIPSEDNDEYDRDYNTTTFGNVSRYQFGNHCHLLKISIHMGDDENICGIIFGGM